MSDNKLICENKSIYIRYRPMCRFSVGDLCEVTLTTIDRDYIDIDKRRIESVPDKWMERHTRTTVETVERLPFDAPLFRDDPAWVAAYGHMWGADATEDEPAEPLAWSHAWPKEAGWYPARWTDESELLMAYVGGGCIKVYDGGTSADVYMNEQESHDVEFWPQAIARPPHG
jgi:hypothetical protein